MMLSRLSSQVAPHDVPDTMVDTLRGETELDLNRELVKTAPITTVKYGRLARGSNRVEGHGEKELMEKEASSLVRRAIDLSGRVVIICSEGFKMFASIYCECRSSARSKVDCALQTTRPAEFKSQPSLCGDKPRRKVEYSWVFKANATVQYVHMGSIAPLRGGRVAAVWQAAGAAEGADDQRLMLSISPDEGRTWDDPTEVSLPLSNS
eukprot:3019832-Pyramimonas_sp.AAC.1